MRHLNTLRCTALALCTTLALALPAQANNIDPIDTEDLSNPAYQAEVKHLMGIEFHQEGGSFKLYNNDEEFGGYYTLWQDKSRTQQHSYYSIVEPKHIQAVFEKHLLQDEADRGENLEDIGVQFDWRETDTTDTSVAMNMPVAGVAYICFRDIPANWRPYKQATLMGCGAFVAEWTGHSQELSDAIEGQWWDEVTQAALTPLISNGGHTYGFNVQDLNEETLYTYKMSAPKALNQVCETNEAELKNAVDLINLVKNKNLDRATVEIGWCQQSELDDDNTIEGAAVVCLTSLRSVELLPLCAGMHVVGNTVDFGADFDESEIAQD